MENTFINLRQARLNVSGRPKETCPAGQAGKPSMRD